MSTTQKTRQTTQVHRVYIKAAPERIWEAITTPEWTARYGYTSPNEYDLRPGGAFKVKGTPAMVESGAPEVIIEGEVIESDPPRRLVQTWHPLWDDAIAAEPPTRLTWEIEAGEGGVSCLTVTHEVEDAPIVAAMVAGEVKEAGGGWAFILSDLKSLLETGSSMHG